MVPKEKENVHLLKSFHVTSPWSDRHSLIAHWSWFPNADLQYFEKAYVYYYNSLDEGFERSKSINEPITSFTINNLRPETVYFVCLRVLRRRRPNSHIVKPTSTSTFSPLRTATTKSAPTLQLPWNQRQPLNQVAPDNYAFEVKCNEATTQNWHLTALIGGIMGVVFALILGLLLLIALKHKHWWQGGSKNQPEKSLLNHSYNQNSRTHAQAGWKHGSNGAGFKNNIWGRSSSSRGFSEFSGNLREEEEEDEDEAIAEDDEDTEADTGCKSSVRSQAGIYCGSGGTTSSNRHSSVSSIDPRDDASSVAHHLPVNGQLVNKRGSRNSRQDIRDLKRASKSGVLSDQPKVLISHDLVADEYPGVKVNIFSPSPEIGSTTEDLSVATEVNLPRKITQCDQRINARHSVFDQTTALSIEAPRRMTIGAPLLTKEPIYVKPRVLREHNFILEKVDSFCDQKFPTPLPLMEPQPISLTHPVLLERLTSSTSAALTSFSAASETWIKSPRVENSATMHFVKEVPFQARKQYEDEDDDADNLEDEEEDEPSLNLSSASMKTDSIYEACLGSYFVGTDQSIYAEFVETI